jgi:16S rRNA (guanine1207-N2)-methyltransferase
VIRTRVHDVDLVLETHPRLFSPARIDAGTAAMLSCVVFEPGDKVLDLGCGYGVVGIVAAKRIGADRVWLLDNDPIAIELARRNATANGVNDVSIVLSDDFEQLREAGFSKILCNPPYHADFGVPKRFIQKGFNRLVIGGTMWMVAQRRTWYRNKLRAIFGGATEHERAPYIVFEATRRSASWTRQS